MKRSEWYLFWDDALGTVKVEFFRRMAFLHVELKRPLEGIRKIKEYLPTLKAWLRSLGYRKVHVIIPEGDDKLYRFERMFGFNEVKRAKGQILMAQEC